MIDAFLNTIHFSIGKVLKGATSVRGLVEPLLWNPGPCDANATLPLYPLYDDENPAPKKAEKPAFDDPVRPSKKGPLVLAILVGLIALVVWAVVAIVHAATTGCIGALPFVF